MIIVVGLIKSKKWIPKYTLKFKLSENFLIFIRKVLKSGCFYDRMPVTGTYVVDRL